MGKRKRKVNPKGTNFKHYKPPTKKLKSAAEKETELKTGIEELFNTEQTNDVETNYKLANGDGHKKTGSIETPENLRGKEISKTSLKAKAEDFVKKVKEDAVYVVETFPPALKQSNSGAWVISNDDSGYSPDIDSEFFNYVTGVENGEALEIFDSSIIDDSKNVSIYQESSLESEQDHNTSQGSFIEIEEYDSKALQNNLIRQEEEVKNNASQDSLKETGNDSGKSEETPTVGKKKKKKNKGKKKKIEPEVKEETLMPKKHKKEYRQPRIRRKDCMPEDPPIRVPIQEINVGDYLFYNYNAKGTLLVFVRVGDILSFHGKAQVGCLWGTVNCLGHTFDHEEMHDVYAPDCGAVLSFTVTSAPKLKMWDLLQEHPRLNARRLYRTFRQLGSSFAAITFKCLKHTDTTRFIRKIKCYETLFNSRIPNVDMRFIDKIGCFISVGETSQGLNFSEEHMNAAEKFVSSISEETSPIVLLCGGKNSGKSTMARYISNRSLGKCPEIMYLECDIGQTEFTPSGCISLNRVSEKYFGPPFTHLSKPLRSCFVGVVSPADDTEHYLNCLRYVFEGYKNLPGKKPPLVVNTMGWISGIGLVTLAEIIRLVHPDLVIQLSVSNQKMPPTDKEFMTTTPPLEELQNRFHSDTDVYYAPEYELITIPVYPLVNRGIQKYKPADIRGLSILSYLCDIYVQSNMPTIERLSFKVKGKMPFFRWTPYRRSWNSLALHVCHLKVPNSQIMYALNGSLVALCIADTKEMLVPRDDYLPKFFLKSPVCTCLGFGFVRAIDPVTKLFHILTPMDPEDLLKVNCLLKGTDDLPTAMIADQPGLEERSFPPYVEFMTSNTSGRLVKERRHLLRSKGMASQQIIEGP